MDGPLTSRGKQQETFVFSSPCLPISRFFPPAVNEVSPQREQLVPPAAAHMARQTPTHHLHPPTPLPGKSCCLTATPAIAFSIITASATLIPLTVSWLCHHLHSPIHPLSGAQMDESLGCPGMLCRGTGFFFSYGCIISCNQRGEKKTHTNIMLTSLFKTGSFTLQCF